MTASGAWDRRDTEVERHLETLWEREASAVGTRLLGEEAIQFQALRDHVHGVLRRCVVIVENSRSDWRLTYAGDPKTYIVVGGNTLSRGLTLEGLVVSYFVRAASAYDTLLQMARWFGYRRGYSDLPRIWMTSELQDAFRDLALVEHEMRSDIRRYESEGITPLQFAPRIRTHPSLEITSALKIIKAVDVDVSYSGRAVQTILFDHRNRAILAGNQAALRALVATLGPGSSWADDGPRLVRRGAPAEAVLQFIRSYSFHPNNVEIRSRLVEAYIRAQLDEGQLATWNVAIIGRRTAARPFPVGFDRSVGLLQRSRIRRADDSYVSLGVVTSEADFTVDLGVGYTGLRALEDRTVIEARKAAGPLLLLYPIDKDSPIAAERQPGAIDGRGRPCRSCHRLPRGGQPDAAGLQDR